MRVLVVPDIHVKPVQAEIIIHKEPNVDKIVFLGDYFDDFFDTTDQNVATMEWLRESFKVPNRIHLGGNHDIHYIYPQFACSGFTKDKYFALHPYKEVLGWLRMAVEIDGVLYSHAGFSENTYQDNVTAICLESLYTGTPLNLDNFVGVSKVRGGTLAEGGCLWRDWSEGVGRINGMKQVVGHTPNHFPRNNGDDAFCIDTHLKHYAIVEDGNVTVKEVD